MLVEPIQYYERWFFLIRKSVSEMNNHDGITRLLLNNSNSHFWNDFYRISRWVSSNFPIFFHWEKLKFCLAWPSGSRRGQGSTPVLNSLFLSPLLLLHGVNMKQVIVAWFLCFFFFFNDFLNFIPPLLHDSNPHFHKCHRRSLLSKLLCQIPFFNHKEPHL